MFLLQRRRVTTWASSARPAAAKASQARAAAATPQVRVVDEPAVCQSLGEGVYELPAMLPRAACARVVAEVSARVSNGSATDRGLLQEGTAARLELVTEVELADLVGERPHAVSVHVVDVARHLAEFLRTGLHAVTSCLLDWWDLGESGARSVDHSTISVPFMNGWKLQM